MFTYKYGGKDAEPRKLVVSRDKVVVRTTRSVDSVAEAVQSDETKEILEQFAQLEDYTFPDANVTVLENKAAAKDRSKYQNRARRSLSKEKEVEFAGRVLEDAESGEPVIYTENIFVKFRDELKASVAKKILKGMDLMIKDQPPYAENAFFVEAKGKGTEVFNIAEDLLAMDEVEAAHPELLQRRVARVAKPQAAKEQWHLRKTPKIDAHVNVEEAWHRHKIRGKGITIAIIDDGVELRHSEFKGRGKVVKPHDVLSQTDDPNPRFSDEDHGTCCAGVACASGKKAPGVAPAASLMPIRLAAKVVGSMTEAAAIYYAAQNRADVISCSWGPPDGHGLATTLPDHTRLAIDYAVTHGRKGKGCVIIWAAGNGNESVDDDGYASYEPVIAVGACTKDNVRASFSDFGKAIWCTFPGGEDSPKANEHGIYTTTLDDSYTAAFIGTSASCPGVAGIAALILCANPDLSYREVKAVLRLSASRLDEANGEYDAHGRSPFYGYGRPDASRAVGLALEMKAKGLGGDDFISDEVQLEAITFTIDPTRTTRAELKKHLKETKVLGSGWIFRNVEHTQDSIDALYRRKTKCPSVSQAWNLSYRLRDHPDILEAEPSFIVTIDGVTEDIHKGIARSIDFCKDDPATDGVFEWSLKQIKAPEAWAFSSQNAPGKAFGEGVLVGHPDSGYRDHKELNAERLVLTNDKDFIDDDDETQEASSNGNHGLGTASVIMSGRNQGARPFVTGAAPKAKLMPLRVAKRTLFPVPVLVFGGMRRLRRAINHAIDEGCQVISISLGGIPNRYVGEAIERAVNRGVIVCAAAGNVVGWVTYPGSDKNAVGVAASNIHRKHWKESCRGSQVDVSAPGEQVWRARVDEDGKEIVERSCGTSFSVAATAGIAALWLAHHGRAALLNRYGAAGQVTAFREVLESTCSQDHELPDGFGAGIVDAEAVVKTALPEPSTIRARRHVKRSSSTMDHLAGLFDDTPRRTVRANLAQLLQVERGALTKAVDDVGRELLFQLATDPHLYDNFKEVLTPGKDKRERRRKRRSRAGMRRSLQAKGVSEKLEGYL